MGRPQRRVIPAGGRRISRRPGIPLRPRCAARRARPRPSSRGFCRFHMHQRPSLIGREARCRGPPSFRTRLLWIRSRRFRRDTAGLRHLGRTTRCGPRPPLGNMASRACVMGVTQLTRGPYSYSYCLQQPGAGGGGHGRCARSPMPSSRCCGRAACLVGRQRRMLAARGPPSHAKPVRTNGQRAAPSGCTHGFRRDHPLPVAVLDSAGQSTHGALQPLSSYDHRRLLVRVQGAEVAVCAGCGEGEGEPVAGIQHR